MSEAIDVLRDIDQLRRDLSGYHGQLKAHNDLQRHCDNQRERITELEGLYAIVKQDRDAYKRQAERFVVENVKLRELVRDLWPFAKAGWVHACPNRECCLFEKCDADSEYECPIEEYMDGRMRELGVEVDG